MPIKLTKGIREGLAVYLAVGFILCLVQIAASVSIVNSYRITGLFPIPITLALALSTFGWLCWKNLMNNKSAVLWTVGFCCFMFYCSHLLSQNVGTASPTIF